MITIFTIKPGVNFSHTGRNLLSERRCPEAWLTYLSLLLPHGDLRFEPGEPLNVKHHETNSPTTCTLPPQKKTMAICKGKMSGGKGTLVVFLGPSDFHDGQPGSCCVKGAKIPNPQLSWKYPH